MTTIDSATAAPGTAGRFSVGAPSAAIATSGASAATAMPATLSIEELVQWLGMQLNKTDGALQTQMDDLSNAKDRLAQLAKLKTDIDRFATDGGRHDEAGVHFRDVGAYASKEGIPADVWKAMGPALQAKYEDMSAAKHTLKSDEPSADRDAWLVSESDLKNFSDAIQDEMGRVTSGNETKLMTLQSAVSARSQMVEMISAMIKKSTDTTSAIVGNMR